MDTGQTLTNYSPNASFDWAKDATINPKNSMKVPSRAERYGKLNLCLNPQGLLQSAQVIESICSRAYSQILGSGYTKLYYNKKNRNHAL